MKALKKVNNEIEKVESQIQLLQARLQELKNQRTQLENAEMIAAIRDAKFDANEMLAVIASSILQLRYVSLPESDTVSSVVAVDAAKLIGTSTVPLTFICISLPFSERNSILRSKLSASSSVRSVYHVWLSRNL